MKIEKIICDRCGKEVIYPISTHYNILEKHSNFFGGNCDIKMDLCQDCCDSLKEWVKENKDD